MTQVAYIRTATNKDFRDMTGTHFPTKGSTKDF